MYRVQYGNKTIEYSILEQEGLKSHYISVEKGQGVILKGKSVSLERSQQLILKKAKWILDKLDLVRAVKDTDIVTGARMPYLGRKYYVQLYINEALEDITLQFNQSKFKVFLPTALNKQDTLLKSFELFYQKKAIEKISPRVRKWSKKISLPYNKLKFMKLEKRWGSCTPSNNIIINTEAIKLPFSLIDYLIVHELVHTKVKNHSKVFWAELSKYMVNWKELDDRMCGMKL